MSSTDVITFGCRLNAFELEVLRAHATAAGLGPTVVVNSCAVTQEAVRQASQAIRRVRRERPEARIVVTGCAAQIETARFAGMREVDHVLGNGEKMLAASWLALNDGLRPSDAVTGPSVRVGDIMSLNQTARHMIDAFGTRARAYVEIQNGCDHRCTFCIIPFGRGPSRSVAKADVVAQVRRLVEAGYGEVVLTGVDLTSWGGDLGADERLGDLVRHVLSQVPALPRLRLSSIDSIEADEVLLRAFADEARLMPHLHLSLQAGDDLVLKRMKRRHLRADAIDFCARMRRLRPDIVFGADLIAGFPTETEAMFANSERLVDECGLTYLHVFPFSSRPGTPAARMPSVAAADVRSRAARLRAHGERVLARFLDGQVGREDDVLIEGAGLARTGQFASVRLGQSADRVREGDIARVRIEGRDGHRLMGEMVT